MKLLEKYYEEDLYDYREDLCEEITELDEQAQDAAFEARVGGLVPLIDSIRHHLDRDYPDLAVEEIASALKYLIDGEMGSSVIIYGDEVMEGSDYPEDIQKVGEDIDKWIGEYVTKKRAKFEIVEIVFVFDQLIRGYRGSEEDDQFILIPESEYDDEEEE
ncbi:MAG: hypothetical protein A4E32_01380 [Methanomassiliicoccales archaeon PtaU1.Bin124]|nr:MAG: hypothetical protein A4E32_01380 [Methanomassiliicoccales archaeon PtaU1.Bin124]